MQNLDPNAGQKPAQQPNQQPKEGNEKQIGKYPTIPNMNGKENRITTILDSYGVPKDADTKEIKDKEKIKGDVGYTGNDRGEFLVKVAEFVGINVFVGHSKQEQKDKNGNFTKVGIDKICHDKVTDMPKEYQQDPGSLFIRKIRMIMTKGLGYWNTRNNMPNKEMK